MSLKGLLASALIVLLPTWAEARCISSPLPFWRLTNPRSLLVVQGTVRDTSRIRGGEIVNLLVDRVWRGRATRDITIFNSTGSVDRSGVELTVTTAARVKVGERYVIFLGNLTPEVRRSLEAHGHAPTLLETGGCRIVPADHPEVRELGKGRPPE